MSSNKTQFPLKRLVEGIILAMIVAMVARTFCVEAFKIPTSSMEPTLIGDPRCGDHILVNKTAYVFKKPKRWDVIVFRYPLNNSRPFIKRAIGLPGESVSIINGDVYINGKLERKPKTLQETLLYPLMIASDKISYQDYWEGNEDWKIEKQQIKASGKNISWLQYSQTINNEYVPIEDNLFYKRAKKTTGVGGKKLVGEVRLEFSAVCQKEGNLFGQIKEGSFIFEFCFSFAKNSQSYLRQQNTEKKEITQEVKISTVWEVGKNYNIRFSNLDDLVTLQANNVDVAILDYGSSLSQFPSTTLEAEVKIGAQGEFLFSNISLWRDIYYLSNKMNFGNYSYVWEVPDKNYFVLGDNCPNSQDSRDWQKFLLFQQNGITIEGDQMLLPTGSVYQFTDVYGRKHLIDRETVKGDIWGNRDSPYVPEEYLMGQGLLVFWPPVRMKFIK